MRMNLTVNDIAGMIDLSCVRTYSSRQDILELVENAKKFNFGQVSVMQCFLPLTKELVRDFPQIHIIGNVSFPSGSDSTNVKVFQTRELVAAGCDEVDVVLNVAYLRSGMDAEAAEDVKAVIAAAGGLPVKVIIEVSYLTPAEVERACHICVDCGATFVKTGTGWAEKGTTVEDIKLIRSIVGDRIKITSSGGIRNLDTLLEMYKHGARRFGVNLKSGLAIVEECLARGGSVEIN